MPTGCSRAAARARSTGRPTPRSAKLSVHHREDGHQEFGKIIASTPRASGPGRSTSGVRLLNLEADDKVASATVIPPEEPRLMEKTARSCSKSG